MIDIHVKQDSKLFGGKSYKKVLKKVVLTNKHGEHLIDAGVAISNGYIKLHREDSGDFYIELIHPQVSPVIGLELVPEEDREIQDDINTWRGLS